MPEKEDTEINVLDHKGTFLEIMNEARSWVDSLDRTPLGDFAVTDAALAYAYGKQINDDPELTWNDSEYALARSGIKPDEDVAALYEMSFWLLRNEPHNHIINLDDVRRAISDWDRLSRVALAFVHQHAHPYFAVGVWDVSLIDQCIADGIDPELAAGMSGAR